VRAVRFLRVGVKKDARDNGEFFACLYDEKGIIEISERRFKEAGAAWIDSLEWARAEGAECDDLPFSR
jgi:hypothetical protein